MKRSLELSKSDIIKVFKANFEYTIEETILGEAIKMPSKDAFVFCNVTGAGYLDDFIFPFTPKGLMKLFYNAFDYKFVTGVFENTTLKYTPYQISKWKPFVFDSEYKYVVPVEFKSEVELQEYLEDVFLKLEKPTDYVIMRVETRKKGNGLESFMEYLAGEYFKRNGYIVENQVPLAHSVGSPDFGGYQLSSITQATKNYLPGGYHIIELAMLRLGLTSSKYDSLAGNDGNLIVGEAKTSTLEMDSQLKKYLNTGLYDWGFEIHPNKQSPTYNDRGMFTLDNNFKITFTEPVTLYDIPDSEECYPKDLYISWLEDYMKFYLLANLTHDEFESLYREYTGEQISDQQNIVRFVKSISIKRIINIIDKLNNGTL